MLKQKKSKKAKYKAVIIGAGRIASGFDSPKSREILTHAHGFFSHPKIELVGIFDIDKKAADKAARKWKSKTFYNLDKIVGEVKPDIISICTSDSDHFNTLKKIVKFNPKIVVCEKPVTENISDTRKIISLYKENKVPLLVNYRRRFEKEVQVAKKDIESGKYGKVISATGIYGKGILHNGSHMIDLSRFLFGELKNFKTLYRINDYDKRDKSIAGFLEFEKCRQFYLQTGDERKFSIFEMDIILENRRIRFIDEGLNISVQGVVRDNLFSGYKILGKQKIKSTSLNKVFLSLVNHVVSYLDGKEFLISDADNALKTQEICVKLLK